jgi:hypothetical protein
VTLITSSYLSVGNFDRRLNFLEEVIGSLLWYNRSDRYKTPLWGRVGFWRQKTFVMTWEYLFVFRGNRKFDSEDGGLRGSRRGLAHYCRGSLLEVIRCIEVASNSQSQPSIPYTLNVSFWNLDFPSTNAANSSYMFLVSCMRLAESLASNGVNNRLQPTTKRPVLGSAEFWRPSFTYFWMLYVEYKCRKSQQLGRRIEGCWLARTAIIPYSLRA